MARLGDICVINPKSPGFQDELTVSFIPMPKVGENGEFDSSETRTYQEVKKGFTYFQNDDVLFAKITPCMENGKGAIAQSLKNGIGFGSTEFYVLRPISECVTSKWLFYLLSWPVFRKEAEKNMTGSAGQKRVPKSFLEEYIVDVPDLSTQEQMTNALDKICDLISLRKQQLAKLDGLVKARFVEMFGEQSNNNKHWPVVKLDSLFRISSSKRIYQNEQVQIGIPFLRISDLMQKITTGNVNAELFIPIETYNTLKAKDLVPKPNDILITSRGTLGQCYVVTEQDQFYFQDGMISWLSDMNKNVVAGYIAQLFLMEGFRRQIDDAPSGTTVNYLSIERLKILDVMLPPIELQQYFVEFKAEICKRRLTIQQSLDKLEVLKKSLMQKYFM